MKKEMINLAGANIKIGATSSEFQRQMKEVVNQLKLTQSQFSVASEKAKLFGTSTDYLKAKQIELTKKFEAQNKVLSLQKQGMENTKRDIDNYKKSNDELAKNIERLTKEQKESVQIFGENSKEVKTIDSNLEKLKRQYNQNETAIQKANKSLENQTLKFDRETKSILQTEAALQKINGKLSIFGDRMKNASEKSGAIADKMKPISVGLIGTGIAAGKMSIDFENSMAKVSTIADTTQVPLETLKESILKLSSQTGISADEIANNVYDAISAGQKTGDAVNFVTNSTKLAKSGFADAGQSLDLLTTIMNSYGLQASDVTKVSDTLIQTQNLGKVTVGELSEVMGKVIPTAKAYGVNLTQTSAGYALMTSKGIKAAETTTYMNSMFNELGKSGTIAQKALLSASGKTFPELIKSGKTLGDILNIMSNYAKKNSKSLNDMFGSAEAGKAAMILSENAGKDFNNMLGKMSDSVGATDKAFEKVNNTSGQKFKTAINEGKNALIGFGDVLAPFIGKFSSMLSGITNFFNGLSKNQKAFVVGLGSVFIATNLALSGFSKLTKSLHENINTLIKFKNGIKNIPATLAKAKESLINGTKTVIKFTSSFVKGSLNIAKSTGKLLINFGKVTVDLMKQSIAWTINTAKLIAYKAAQLAVSAATKVMTAAQWLLNAALSANPIGIVIGLLVALGASFVILYNKCDWFRNGVISVWNGISNVFKSFANFFKNGFTRDWTQSFGLLGVPLNSFFKIVGSIVNGVKGIFGGLIDFFTGVFSGNWRKAFQGLSNIVSNIFGMIGGVIKAPINAAISGINWVISNINGIGFDVPSWVPGIGGSHFGINLPSIPMLENGGIVTKATLALVGEGKEHEAVIPLSKLDKLVTNSVRKVINNSDTKEIKDTPPKFTQVVFQVGNKKLAEALYDDFGVLIQKNQNSRKKIWGG